MAKRRPSRYALDGSPPDIVCSDWPTMHLHVERGLSIEERELKSFPRQSIFLDGVFTGPAFLNNETRQYSLDHHAGCVRAFTLATCEQACVMLMQRLPLWEGEWQLYVNEPDLDSLLAAWILLNHYALSHDDYVLLRKVMPLVRVEGVIDTFGLDKALLSGLPRRIYEAKHQRIVKLRQPEQKLREKGEWSTTDLVAFSKSQLERLDANLFPHGSPRIGGVEKFKLDQPNRTLAFLVPSRRGIYEIEEELRGIHKDELAVIVLDSGHGRMTLRLANAFLPKDLTAAYAALNARDQRVSSGDESNAWGGSAEIGGAPRRMGTGLSGREVLETVIAALNSEA